MEAFYFCLFVLSAGLVIGAVYPDETVGESWIGVPSQSMQQYDLGFNNPAARVPTDTITSGNNRRAFIEISSVNSFRYLQTTSVSTNPSWMTFMRIFDTASNAFVVNAMGGGSFSSCRFDGFLRTRRNMMVFSGVCFDSGSDVIFTYDPPRSYNLSRHDYLMGIDAMSSELRPIRRFSVVLKHRHPYLVTTYRRTGTGVSTFNGPLIFLFSVPVRACNLTSSGNYAIELNFTNVGNIGQDMRLSAQSTWLRSWYNDSQTNFSAMWYTMTNNRAFEYYQWQTYSTPNVFAVCDEQGRQLEYWQNMHPFSYTSCTFLATSHALLSPSPPVSITESQVTLLIRTVLPVRDSTVGSSFYAGTGSVDSDGILFLNFTTSYRAVTNPSSSSTTWGNVVTHSPDSRLNLVCSAFTSASINLVSYLQPGFTIDLSNSTASFSVWNAATFQVSASNSPPNTLYDSVACMEYDRDIYFQTGTASNQFINRTFDPATINSLYNVSCFLTQGEIIPSAAVLQYWPVEYQFPTTTLTISSVVAHYQDRFVYLTASDLLWTRSADPYQVLDGCNRTAKSISASGNSIVIELWPGCSNFSIAMSPRTVHSYTSGFVGYSTQMVLHSAENMTLSVTPTCVDRSAMSLSFNPSIASPTTLTFNCSDALVSLPVSAWTFDATPVYDCTLDLRFNGVYHLYTDNHPESFAISSYCTDPVNATCLVATGELYLELDPPYSGDNLTFSCPSGEHVRSYSNRKVSIAGLHACTLNFTKYSVSNAAAIRVSDYCPLIFSVQTGSDDTDPSYIYVYGENRTILVYVTNQTVLLDPNVDFLDIPLIQAIAIPLSIAVAFFLLGMVVYSLCKHRPVQVYSSLPASSSIDLSPRQRPIGTTANASSGRRTAFVPFDHHGLPLGH